MILSLKHILMCCLDQILFSHYEANKDNFIDFLRKNGTQYNWISEVSLISDRNWRKIPLQKKQREPQALYVSALPQIVAKAPISKQFQNLAEVSKRMVERLHQTQCDSSDPATNIDLDHSLCGFELCSRLWSEFEIETTRDGWIAFRLSDRGTARWLHQIYQGFCQVSDHPPRFSEDRSLSQQKYQLSRPLESVDQDHIRPNSDRFSAQSFNQSADKQSAKHLISDCRGGPLNDSIESVPIQPIYPSLGQLNERQRQGPKQRPRPTKALLSSDPSLWQVQYTHARCCSLLRLWADICPAAREKHPQPAVVPWMSDEYPQLRLDTPQDQDLIQALIETADSLFWIPYRWPDRQYSLLLRASAQLCQSFETFYKTRLSGFGQVSSSAAAATYRLFQARFALVAATKSILKHLLSSHFDARSPISL